MCPLILPHRTHTRDESLCRIKWTFDESQNEPSHANVCCIPTIEPCLTAASRGVPQWRWRTRWLGCVTRWPSRRQSRRRHWVRSRQPSRASSAHDSRSVSRRRPFPTTSREQKEAAFGRDEESAEGARVGWWLAVDKKLEGEIRTKIAPLSDKVSPSTLNPLKQAANSHPCVVVSRCRLRRRRLSWRRQRA